MLLTAENVEGRDTDAADDDELAEEEEEVGHLIQNEDPESWSIFRCCKNAKIPCICERNFRINEIYFEISSQMIKKWLNGLFIADAFPVVVKRLWKQRNWACQKLARFRLLEAVKFICRLVGLKGII